MTTRATRSAKSSGIEALGGGDRDVLKQMVQGVLQEILEAEMTGTLSAGPTSGRPTGSDTAPGNYSRSLMTRIGKLELRAPRDCDGRFDRAVCPLSAHGEGAGEHAGGDVCAEGVSAPLTRVLYSAAARCCGPRASCSGTIAHFSQANSHRIVERETTY